MGKWSLKANPFSRKAIKTEEDFDPELTIITRTMRNLLNGLAWGYTPGDPFYEVLIGARGAGKTTDLLTIKQNIDSNTKENIRTCYVNKYILLPQDKNLLFGDTAPMEFEQEGMDYILEKQITSKQAEIYKSKDSRHLGTLEHYYIFIDVPDEYRRDQMRAMLQAIDDMMNFKNISIYMAINHINFTKADKLTELMGKTTRRQMPEFELSETLEMVKKRLKYYREKGRKGKNPLFPFTLEAIQYAHERWKGNPRNTISHLSITLNELLQSQENEITKQHLEDIFGNSDYRMEVIREHTEDENLIKVLKMLIEIIENQFGGLVKTQKSLNVYMASNHGWSDKTTVGRLRKLIKWGLVEMETASDFWTKTYRLR